VANVLFLTLVFPPDSVSTAQIMGELAADLHNRGHHVTVVTTAPHYNRDRQAETRQPLRPLLGPLLQRSTFHGSRVYHTWMPRKGRGVVGRILAWLLFHALSTVVCLCVRPRPDILIVPSPPLTIGISAWVVARMRRARFIYNVQEIYPDIAVNLGALRNRAVIRALEGVERFIYDRAAAVTVIAPRMRRRLLEKGVEPKKVDVLPNFVDTADFTPGSKRNSFSVEWNAADCFLVTYAGNLGPAQGLETFIDAAALIQDQPNVRCMLIGAGISEASLQARIEMHGLTNVELVPHQPYSRVPEIYAASDVCLVAQAALTGADAIPSKVYRIMASARPIIACTDPVSDLAQLVDEAGCGVIVEPGSPEALAVAIRQAVRDPDEWRRMGMAGRNFVERHYARERVTNRYHQLVERLTSTTFQPADVG
jgi:colanic acid biosynthesis glycosyl transferase WcaI